MELVHRKEIKYRFFFFFFWGGFLDSANSSWPCLLCEPYLHNTHLDYSDCLGGGSVVLYCCSEQWNITAEVIAHLKWKLNVFTDQLNRNFVLLSSKVRALTLQAFSCQRTLWPSSRYRSWLIWGVPDLPDTLVA